MPNRFKTGVTLTVRLAPAPPNTMLALGTTVALDDVALTVSAPAGVSKSPTVKAIWPAARREFGDFRGTTREELLGWLRQILLNHLATVRRRYLVAQKRAARREVSLDGSFRSAAESLAADVPSPSSHLVQSELVEAVEAAVERLPERQRTAIRLRHVEQLPFEEVARQLKLSSAAARQLWARAVKGLRRELRGME